jgi:hypothetical protein
MPSNEWLALGKAFAGDTFKVTIAGSSGKDSKVALSDETTMHFSPQGVFGALYYWAAEAAEIKRADLGSDQATPFIQPNSPTNKYDCVGCHSVSRNGEVIAFAVAPILSSVEGSELAGIQTAPTSDPSMPYVAPKNGDSPFAGITDDDGTEMFPDGIEGPKDHLGHNVALSPTGDYAAVNGIPAATGTWPPFFEIRDTKSGDTLGKWSLADPIFGSSDDGSEKLAIFPEWAPDGKSMVVTIAEEAGENCMYTAETCKGALAILPVTGAGKIGSPQILVEASTDEFYFYPTWSPDGKWVAFAAGIRRMSGGKMETSQSNDNALIRLVKATGGPYKCPSKDCIELTKGRGYSFADAEDEKGKHSTWPKFTPFAQDDGNLMFISFNSHLDYGFEEPVTGKEGERLSQIWMFAVDVSKVGSGDDPSYAPIWLPQQDPGDGSLTPYWSERLPCNQDPSGGCKGCVGDEKCETQEDGQCSCIVDVL